ncbi:UPF0524 protein C3orf70 [Manis javanica]|nr:UPF0524 protein C3orf70 [Manis javanica]
MSAAASAPERGWKSEKVDEAQALARSCAARRPDFQPCDGLSICATHSHGKCFKLHWCCHLGWCHCKYVYQPMTPVEQLPSTEIPAKPREPTNTIQISVSLTEHFLKFASVFQPPLPPDSPRKTVAFLEKEDLFFKRRCEPELRRPFGFSTFQMN